MSCELKIHYEKKLERNISRTISPKGKYHDPEKVITFSFLEGTDIQKNHVRSGIAKILVASPGLKIEEVKDLGDVRISFNQYAGAYSYVGTDIYLVPKSQETMNLGWLEASHRVVIHEWLHTLNFSHEMLHPEINWDKPKVYEYFEQIGWDKRTVDNNLFLDDHDHYDIDEIDVDSIMMYYLPCSLTLDGEHCGHNNSVMSQGDIDKLNEMFPYSSPEPEEKGELEEFLKKIFKSEKDLDRLLEIQLVIMANELGILAKRSDKKSDTVSLIFNKLNNV